MGYKILKKNKSKQKKKLLFIVLRNHMEIAFMTCVRFICQCCVFNQFALTVQNDLEKIFACFIKTCYIFKFNYYATYIVHIIYGTTLNSGMGLILFLVFLKFPFKLHLHQFTQKKVLIFLYLVVLIVLLFYVILFLCYFL